MSQTYLLYRLQQTDNTIRAKKQRLQEVVLAQKQNEALQQAQQREQQTQQTLATARSQQKDLELELAGINSKAKRSEERLYSGRVTNPKELGDLQQEISSLKRRRNLLEDDILEVMFLVEEAEEDYEAAAASLSQMEASWQERLTVLQEEQQILVQELRQLLQEREEQAGQLDRKALNLYDATAKRRGGVAVAALQNGLCQACGIRVSGSVAQAARADQLVHCGSCGRLLHLM